MNRMPAEWEPHDACWVAWPSHADLWGDDLGGVQDEFVAFCEAIAWAPSGCRSEQVHVLVPNAARRAEAQVRLSRLPVTLFEVGFGDIWLRDTGPIFLSGDSLVAACFGFNGWGSKHNLPHDPEVSHKIALKSQARKLRFDWVLEGGSIEVDGQGACLTSEQCLLNKNRNPDLSREAIEGKLKTALGVQTILWLHEGLVNDHTDGHIDTIARFTAPGEAVCMAPSGADDPNARVLEAIARDLGTFHNAQGRRLKVHRIPSPGKIVDASARVLPASYVNFYLSNHSVIVPTYGCAQDETAVREIGKLFPSRRALGLSARVLLRGGGAFHCITQQQPTKEGHHVD